MLMSPAHVQVHYSRSRDVASATRAAVNRYRVAQRKAFWGRVKAQLTGHPCQLRGLDTALVEQATRNEHYVGIVEVPIDAIRGSEGRCRDFDADFWPLQEYTRERWLRVALAFQMGIPLPPIELIEVQGQYFVRDGHHRVSVAKARGQAFIEAKVTQVIGAPVAIPLAGKRERPMSPSVQTAGG